MPASYTIDHNIPLPRGHACIEGRMARLRFLLSQMIPGDSFLYQDGALTHPYQAAKTIGVKITTRKLDRGGYRVWRKS